LAGSSRVSSPLTLLASRNDRLLDLSLTRLLRGGGDGERLCLLGDRLRVLVLDLVLDLVRDLDRVRVLELDLLVLDLDVLAMLNETQQRYFTGILLYHFL
jgi:hypothetical protein